MLFVLTRYSTDLIRVYSVTPEAIEKVLIVNDHRCSMLNGCCYCPVNQAVLLGHLVGESLLLAVAELVQVWETGEVDHWGRPAQEDLKRGAQSARSYHSIGTSPQEQGR